MNTYIGIDLGTSAVKLLLVAADGTILKSVSREYPLSFPHPGWSEQEPEDWLRATKEGLDALLEGEDRASVRGVSFGGQMHGLVILDEEDRVIRPAILWNDGRTQKETDELNEKIGKAKLSEYTANIAFAGFTAPKLLWVKANEPEHFARIAKIMLPKDYLAYRMTGIFSTDYSDAGGMLLLDVKNKKWSEEMCAICGIRKEQLPRLYESYAPTGPVLAEYGLPNAVVSAGAGDNAAAAIGTGTVKDGDCNISLGTSGTVFISQDHFSVDARNALHSFPHASGKHHLMGCILSAASCYKWWTEEVLRSKDNTQEQEGLSSLMGDNDVWFLPYLMGERSPHNDTEARGCFLGMRPDTDRRHMTLAVMEGVAFALRDCVEIAREGGLSIPETKICGGGARSEVWKKVMANVLGIPVSVPAVEEGPAFGAAILAMVAAGEYPTVSAATDALIKTESTVLPEEALVAKYEVRYRHFHKLYPALRGLFTL